MKLEPASGKVVIIMSVGSRKPNNYAGLSNTAEQIRMYVSIISYLYQPKGVSYAVGQITYERYVANGTVQSTVALQTA